MQSPISDAQLEANRRNAEKSTGPRTDAGKAASSANSKSHGLTGRIEFQHPRDQLDYAALGQRMTAEAKPCTAVEEHLVQTILDSQWQMNRCRAFDEQIWRERAAGIYERPDGLTPELVNRYLQMHTRIHLHAIDTLRKTQNARKREARNEVIFAAEAHYKQPYDRRKHGIVLPPDGFVLQACPSHAAYQALKLEAEVKIASEAASQSA
jgi:hypothetical protein